MIISYKIIIQFYFYSSDTDISLNEHDESDDENDEAESLIGEESTDKYLKERDDTTPKSTKKPN